MSLPSGTGTQDWSKRFTWTERKSLASANTYTPKLYLKTLKEHFGKKRIVGISHADIEAFKPQRLRQPTRAELSPDGAPKGQRKVLRLRPPMDAPRIQIELLQPALAEELDGREFTQPRQGLLGVNCRR